MPAPSDQYSDLRFPEGGIDLSAGFYAQRQGTTRLGRNVRAFEPLTQRMRGGQRPGLSKYVAGQLPTAGLVQHLNTVITASGTALLANFPFTVAGNLDLSSPGPPSAWPPGLTSRIPTGQTIPPGGTGIQPNKLVAMDPVTLVNSGIKHRQTKVTRDLSDGVTHHQTFGSSILSGSVLVVCFISVNTSSSAPPGISGVTDNLLQTYTLIGLNSAAGVSRAVTISMWYVVSVSGTIQVAFDPTGSDFTSYVGIEYTGASSTVAIGAKGSASGTLPFNGFGPVTGGSVSTDGSGQACVGVIGLASNDDVFGPPTSPFGEVSTSLGANTVGYDVLDTCAATGGTSRAIGGLVNPTDQYAADMGSGPIPWCGLSAILRPAP